MDFYVTRDDESDSINVTPAVVGIIAEKNTCRNTIEFYQLGPSEYCRLSRQEKKEVDFDRKLWCELDYCMDVGLNLCREMFKFIPKEGTAWHVYIKKGKVVKEQVFLEYIDEHGC